MLACFGPFSGKKRFVGAGRAASPGQAPQVRRGLQQGISVLKIGLSPQPHSLSPPDRHAVFFPCRKGFEGRKLVKIATMRNELLGMQYSVIRGVECGWFQYSSLVGPKVPIGQLFRSLPSDKGRSNNVLIFKFCMPDPWGRILGLWSSK